MTDQKHANQHDEPKQALSQSDLFDHLSDEVIKPWREQAAKAEQIGDEQRRETLDSCADEVERFFAVPIG